MENNQRYWGIVNASGDFFMDRNGKVIFYPHPAIAEANAKAMNDLYGYNCTSVKEYLTGETSDTISTTPEYFILDKTKYHIELTEDCEETIKVWIRPAYVREDENTN